jgi:hypothetical protein
MFESLDDHIKHDVEREDSKRARVIKWVVTIVVALVIFAGLYLGVRLIG